MWDPLLPPAPVFRVDRDDISRGIFDLNKAQFYFLPFLITNYVCVYILKTTMKAVKDLEVGHKGYGGYFVSKG